MADATEPVLDIERVLFLDERNRRFVEKRSPVTAQVQDARDLFWQIAIVVMLFGAVLFVAATTHLVNSQLTKSGRVTTGTITKKVEYHQKIHLCRLTYRFSGPPIYERVTEVPYDMCRDFTEGQVVEVLYDPQQPLYSNLKVSIRRARYPLWPAVFVFLVVLVIIYSQFLKLQQVRSLCAQGQVICGSMIRKDFEMDRLTIQYSFRAPAGFTIRSQAEGLTRRSNWRHDMQFFPDQPDLVAVFFLSEAEYYLL